MSVTPYTLGNQVTAWIISEGQQSSPQQADREVYENGAEAPHTTQCFFFGFKIDTGLLCKAHADDGDSMARDKHLEYMRELMNTGANKQTAKIGAPTNKGVGARIATLAHNREGMDVYARTPDEARRGEPWHLVRLLPEGLFNFDIMDAFGAIIGTDNIVDAEQSEIDQFPDFVQKRGYGTVVVFRGNGGIGTWDEVQWKLTYNYMQKRYYTLPLRVWVDGEAIPSLAGKSRSDYRYEISSLSDYYAKHTGHKGVVTLSDGAEVEWFVFDHTADGKGFDEIRKSGKDKGKPYGAKMETGPDRVNGFRGVALRDGIELFDHSSKRLSTFNIIGQRATSRVSLIITPPPGLLTPTTNRQSLTGINGVEIPWLEWGTEFGSDLPAPIQALMDKEFSVSDTLSVADVDRLDPDWHKRIAERRSHIVNPDGTLWVEPERPIVAREGSSGGHIGPGPGPHTPSPGPNPGTAPGNNAGNQAGNHNSAARQLARKSSRGQGVLGSQEDLRYLDLQVKWLPDTATGSDPTWSGTVTDPEAQARGWAWYPGGAATFIYLRDTGDPFTKTLAKYLALEPRAKRNKVWQDVRNAYGIEALSKVVHIKDNTSMGWTTADVAEQWKGLHLSFALTGLNSVEAMVEAFLRKTTAPKPKPSGKRTLRRPKP